MMVKSGPKPYLAGQMNDNSSGRNTYTVCDEFDLKKNKKTSTRIQFTKF